MTLNIDLVSFYFAFSITANLMCIVTIITSRLNDPNHTYKAVMLGCIMAIAYQLVTWQYHRAENLEDAVTLLKLQTSIVCLVIPVYFAIFLLWSEARISAWWMRLFIAIGVISLTVNIFSDYSIRYSGYVELIEFTAFNQEGVKRLIGETNPLMQYMQIQFSMMMIGLIYLTSKIFKQKRYLLATSLVCVLGLSVLVSAVAVGIDSGQINSVYLGGLPNTFLNVFLCIGMAIKVKNDRILLDQEIKERKSLETLLTSLAKGVSSSSNETFFLNMLQQLQKLMQSDISLIATYCPQEKNTKIRTLVVLEGTTEQDNFTFPLNKLNQQLIATQQYIHIEQNLAKVYPDIVWFTQNSLESYLAIPLFNLQGEIEGNLVLLFKEPRELSPHELHIFDVFSARAGAELERDRLNKQLHQLAYFDYLTELPNLGHLLELIDKHTLRPKNIERVDRQSVLMLFGLKTFSEINMQYGFKYAERALKILGERFNEYASPKIKFARTGREDFACLIENVEDDPIGILNIHFEAISSLIKTPITIDNSTIQLSSNAAGLVFSADASSSAEVVRVVELALSEAKQLNTNTIRIFEEDSLAAADRQMLIREKLERALNSNTELFPVFQPKVDINNNLLGSEALVRWKTDDLGYIFPTEFISIAEDSGLIDRLGFWMLKQVAKQIVDWQKMGLKDFGKVAVNVSPIQLENPEFIEQSLRILNGYGVKPSQIEFEVTESGLFRNKTNCIKQLTALRDVGFSVALDDFGTGYSSLSYLHELPLDVLKIDRSFVIKLNNKQSRELVKTIISVANQLELSVVAEGTEEPYQIDILAQMGCKVFQGYFFAKPMKGYELFKWVQENNKMIS